MAHPFRPPQANYVKAPKGTHPARLYRVTDKGSIDHPKWGRQRKIMFGLELVTKPMPDDEQGRNFAVFSTFSLSYGKKSLMRPFLEGLLGRELTRDDQREGIDFESLIGLPCNVTVVHVEKDDTTYVNVKTVSPPVEGQAIPEGKLAPEFLSLEPNDFDEGAFNDLSDRLKEQIKQTPEWKELQRLGGIPETGTASDPDDVPFA